MEFADRLRRRRELALIEAQTLARLHHLDHDTLRHLDEQLDQRRQALAGPIEEVRRLMATHANTLEDVLGDGSPKGAGRITHRHPETDDTWNGIGPQPDWVRRALLVEGYRPSDLRVEPPGQGPGGAAPPDDRPA
jgi:DNA-binding protein H-NS